ncbi:zf-HC2 domain-containing protein [Streptomyces sp. NPDC006923]|uniref:anti-sigma factor family protein n=1 Tax=Streptomyces sp. NPDC006923 TaxID=3155355 RepID=UPI003403F2A5
MTTTDTPQHPDVSEISDLAEGLLSPSRSAEVRRHLDTCALCADVRDSLEEIRELLGTLPGPTRMPDDVAGRIDAALAAEAFLDATVSGKDAHVSRETTSAAGTSSVPGTSAAPHSTPPESAKARGGRAERPGSRPRAATGPGRGGLRRWRGTGALLSLVFVAAAVGVSLLLLPSLRPSDSGTSAAKKESSPVRTAANDVFSGTPLKDRVHALLGPSPGPDSGLTSTPGRGGDSSNRDGGGTSNSPMITPVPEVPLCIQHSTGRTDPVLAAETGVYHGSPAYLLILSHPVDSTRVLAYVIDATCVNKAPSGKGKLLLLRPYARH